MSVHVKLEKVPPPIIQASNGERYRVTVRRGNEDVTGMVDWTTLATEVSNAYINNAGTEREKKFRSATIELTGDFKDAALDAAASDPSKQRKVSVLSASFVDEGGTRNNLDQLDTVTAREPVQTALDTIARDFGTIKPVNSPSNVDGAAASSADGAQNPAAPSANDAKSKVAKAKAEANVVAPQSNELIDPRVEICANRKEIEECDETSKGGAKKVEIKGADEALAHQLITMPQTGKTKYSKKKILELAKEIRKEVVEHINKNQKKYLTDNAISSIIEALKEAEAKDSKCFNNAIGQYYRLPLYSSIKEQLGRETQTNLNAISYLLQKEASSLTRSEKIKLVKIYQHYLNNDGKVLNKAFFDAFVEKHKNDEEYFQIVIIDSNGNATLYPSDDKSIDTQRCLFIKYDSANNRYLSYDRTTDSTVGTLKIADLNEKNIIGTVPTPRQIERKKFVPAKIETITVDATGRCLDKSIAFQIAKKDGKANNTNDPAVEELADKLRTEVSTKISTDASLDDDELFFQYLRSAVQAIPAFSTEEQYKTASGIEQKRLSADSIVKDDKAKTKSSSSTLITEIGAILQNGEFSKTKKEDRTKLREFYASYIVHQDNNNKMTNYLDLPFLYVLPKTTPLSNYSTGGLVNGGNSIKCAVLQGENLHLRFPQNEEFKKDETTFVVYNGINHYDALADLTVAVGGSPQPSATAIKLDAIIERGKTESLERLYQLAGYQGTSTKIAKEHLLDTIQHQHPKAYKAMKKIIYDHRVKLWDDDQTPADQNSLKNGKAKPGTENLPPLVLNGPAIDKAEYGHWALNTIEPDELVLLLLSNDMNLKAVNEMIPKV